MIVGDDVVQLNVTVPVVPGFAVNTTPTGSVPPGATGGKVPPGGWLLVAFHVSRVGHTPGEIMHAEEWWGERVDLDFYYLDPGDVVNGLTEAGFTIMSRTDRDPWPGVEHESRRCYLLCRRS